MVNFARQLGAQSGVQLNPLQDNSSLPTVSNYDQVMAMVLRSTRGRIDKPFAVDRGNVVNKLGIGEQMRVSSLNEAWVQLVEALNNGAYQAVVQRLVPAATAQFVATATNTTSLNVTSVSSGALVVGSPVHGPYINEANGGTTIASFGTFNGTSGTVILSQAATAASSTPGVALAQGGSLISNIVAFNGSGLVLGTPTILFPTISLTGGGGSGASATPILNSLGAITGFTIVGGTGYTSAPVAAIVGGGGSGCVLGTVSITATALSGIAITSGGAGYGQLSTIPVVSGGSGYGITGTLLPSVAISGGGAGAGASAVATLNSSGAITGFTITPGAGYSIAPTVAVSQAPLFAVMTDSQLAALTTPYVFAIKDLGCRNDGIQVNWRAELATTAGAPSANPIITINITDSASPATNLYSFVGSLTIGSQDDYGNSNYLPDVIANRTDAVTITMGTIATIATNSLAYGYGASTGTPNWATSGVMIAFIEGGKSYQTSDYATAAAALQNTHLEYGYIASGGTQSPALLYQLGQLSYNTNCPLAFDIPGAYGVAAATAFVASLNFGANPTAQLIWAYWAPFISNDPTGINGKSYIGTSALNVAYACARNAVKDTNGFAKKNYPIAGKRWPVNRTGINQNYAPDAQGQDLNSLALAKINPVIFSTYSDGGLYVFYDSLTQAPVSNSERKLVAVADMAAAVDFFVVNLSNDIKQLPIKEAIKLVNNALRDFFKNAQSAGWLVPSNDPFMNGQAYQYTVTADAARPYDAVDIGYWLRYDGTTRAIYITQTLTT